jgi:hypothetical protein
MTSFHGAAGESPAAAGQIYRELVPRLGVWSSPLTEGDGIRSGEVSRSGAPGPEMDFEKGQSYGARPGVGGVQAD